MCRVQSTLDFGEFVPQHSPGYGHVRMFNGEGCAEKIADHLLVFALPEQGKVGADTGAHLEDNDVRAPVLCGESVELLRNGGASQKRPDVVSKET
jgi:hypothetical protein